jgi:glycosyltransferase involved in cell wall biosynthesis
MSGSIVIPAHDEASVIRRCLASLADVVAARDLEVVVSCNGCTDATAQVARSFGWAHVVETDRASKTVALNFADRVAGSFPRLYVDADVELPGASAAAVIDVLAAGAALAARPPYLNSPDGATALVRSYYRARTRMTSVHGSLWGAGVYGLSAAGRGRFGDWPDIVADDLFVDRLFAADEIAIVSAEPVVVRTPRDVTNLVNVLRRAQRGKGELAALAAPAGSNPTSTRNTARDLLATAEAGPVAMLDATVYAGLAALARASAQVARGPRWERDVSTRLG